MTKYSSRYIEFPVIIIYGCERDEELGEDDIPMAETMFVNAYARINPLQIESYTPDTDGGIPDTEESLVCTRVFMKSGENHLVNMPINEFETYLDEVYSKLYDQS
jgi:hypothetical protein